MGLQPSRISAIYQDGACWQLQDLLGRSLDKKRNLRGWSTYSHVHILLAITKTPEHPL